MSTVEPDRSSPRQEVSINPSKRRDGRMASHHRPWMTAAEEIDADYPALERARVVLGLTLRRGL